MPGSRKGKPNGVISQRDLVPLLRELVDAASVENSTAHKDIAKARLREVLTTCRVNTTYVANNIGPRRARFIASLGYPMPSKWMFTDWRTNRPGEDKGDPDE